MAEKSHLLHLLETVQLEVTAVHDYLVAADQPQPVFDGPEPDYSGIDGTRVSALEALTELRDLILTLRELLQYNNESDLVGRHALDRLGIYDAVPIGSTRPHDEIAMQTKQPVNFVRRLIRHAMTQRIFDEPERGVVTHTNVSRLLTQNKHVRDYYSVKCDWMWPAMACVIDAAEKWPGSQHRDHCGFLLAHGKPLFEMLEDDPKKQARAVR